MNVLPFEIEFNFLYSLPKFRVNLYYRESPRQWLSLDCHLRSIPITLPQSYAPGYRLFSCNAASKEEEWRRRGNRLIEGKGEVSLISRTTALVRHAFRKAITPVKGFVVNDGPASRSMANTNELFHSWKLYRIDSIAIVRRGHNKGETRANTRIRAMTIRKNSPLSSQFGTTSLL